MPYEATLPKEERRFLDIDTEFSFTKFFLVPLIAYFSWAFMYGIINFGVSAKRIKERNYDNMWKYYTSMKWSNDVIFYFGDKFKIVVFFMVHFSVYFSSHLIALP